MPPVGKLNLVVMSTVNPISGDNAHREIPMLTVHRETAHFFSTSSSQSYAAVLASSGNECGATG